MTLRWVPGWNGLTDPDAVSYVAAVEAADGEPLEFGVAKAINDFVLGCKNDGIWDAIKASCILAGARTLAGALVPLVGTAPTNYNFVAGDYNRETGLVGDGSTKYLDSNRAGNADPQDNFHLSVHKTASPSGTSVVYAGHSGTSNGRSFLGRVGGNIVSTNRNISNSGALVNDSVSQTLLGTSRNTSSEWLTRYNGASYTTSISSQVPASESTYIFARSNSGGSAAEFYSSARLSFYSIGESLNLAALDARVTDLMTAIGAAIP